MPKQQGLDRVFAALGCSTRRVLVEQLMVGSASVSELAAPQKLSLPTVTQHLGVLQACGLVRTEKRGRVRRCSLDPAPLAAAESWIAQQRAIWATHVDRLEAFLQRETRTSE